MKMENITDNNDNLIKLYLKAIDNKNVNEINYLFTKNYGERRNKDIVFVLYEKQLLTSERLQFITKNCFKYLNISSSLITRLLKDDNITLLNIIFDHIKVYDNEIIKTFLIYYNRKAISNSNLTELISKEKYVIPSKRPGYI